MWTASDDYGVVKGHPVWLKNQIFPYDDISNNTFAKWIRELETIKSILPFEHNQEKYYFIRTFNNHQKVDRPSLLRNPEPPDNILDTLASHSRDNLDEIKLNKIKEKEIKENINRSFDLFWELYPRKVGKLKAREKFETKYREYKLNGDFIKLLLNSIELQKKSKQWQNPEHIPHPLTWLNGERWNDEVIVEDKRLEGLNQTQLAVLEARRRREAKELEQKQLEVNNG
jgi:hypothetical protein